VFLIFLSFFNKSQLSWNFLIYDFDWLNKKSKFDSKVFAANADSIVK